MKIEETVASVERVIADDHIKWYWSVIPMLVVLILVGVCL